MTALVSFDRVFEVLDLPSMIQERPDALPVPPGPARITFDRVSFRYPTAAEVSLASLESIAVPDRSPQRAILHDISFTVQPGTLTALVGPSGAGKTTITQLIPRLYDVQSGAVAINGMDVRDATLESLRRRIGIVTQDAHLFHDTIRANLLFAKPGANDAELEAALRAAQIWPLVAGLPEGVDTLVGERGHRFSGGEKATPFDRAVAIKGARYRDFGRSYCSIWILNPEAAIQKLFSEIALERADLRLSSPKPTFDSPKGRSDFGRTGRPNCRARCPCRPFGKCPPLLRTLSSPVLCGAVEACITLSCSQLPGLNRSLRFVLAQITVAHLRLPRRGNASYLLCWCDRAKVERRANSLSPDKVGLP